MNFTGSLQNCTKCSGDAECKITLGSRMLEQSTVINGVYITQSLAMVIWPVSPVFAAAYFFILFLPSVAQKQKLQGVIKRKFQFVGLEKPLDCETELSKPIPFSDIIVNQSMGKLVKLLHASNEHLLEINQSHPHLLLFSLSSFNECM